MITPREMLTALLRLSLTNSYVDTGIPLEMAADAWADVINDELPDATTADLIAGVRAYAREATTGWPKPADLTPHIRAAYRQRTRTDWCGQCDSITRLADATGEDGRPIAIRCPTCHPMTKQLTTH